MLTRMMKSADTPLTAEQRIVAAIRAVPRGQPTSYGAVARRAGLPGRARLVARILAHSEGADLPWHRILRSDGRIAFPEDSEAYLEQCQRLRAEGVDVRNGRVRLLQDEESLDSAVWAPR
jgi:methylated-DNA-protein-cysteine methyltransferase-like protein